MNGIKEIAKKYLGQDIESGILVLKGANINNPSIGSVVLNIDSDGDVVRKVMGSGGWVSSGIGFLTKGAGTSNFSIDGATANPSSDNTLNIASLIAQGDIDISDGGHLQFLDAAEIVFDDTINFNSDATFTFIGGDVEVEDIGDGFVAASPDGTRYRIIIANDGALSTEAVV